ncbi:hypothetical protein C8Q79DRAFT_304438 [Trametes meyenii]|nr:hypothetical protein C8Q79DRAFT_304438 [Trametes meyenii]
MGQRPGLRPGGELVHLCVQCTNCQRIKKKCIPGFSGCDNCVKRGIEKTCVSAIRNQSCGGRPRVPEGIIRPSQGRLAEAAAPTGTDLPSSWTQLDQPDLLNHAMGLSSDHFGAGQDVMANLGHGLFHVPQPEIPAFEFSGYHGAQENNVDWTHGQGSSQHVLYWPPAYFDARFAVPEAKGEQGFDTSYHAGPQ